MNCNDELIRIYRSRDEASRYLSSRGFLLLPKGWANGRWSATLEMENGAFIVTIRLGAQEAA